MTRTPVLVTGMFRSGTTLLARMMDAHPAIAFASDPYRPMFNHFRDVVARKHGLEPEDGFGGPLGAYFGDENELKIRRAVEAASFDEPISAASLAELIPVMAKRTEAFSPKIGRRMAAVKGTTYRELFVSMLALIDEEYGKPGAAVTGLKEVWCTEFTPVLARAFPEMKFIHMVRDPRATSASNNVSKDAKYPWLFLCRQWRKLAALSKIQSNDPALAGRILVLRYEDFVSDIERGVRRICEFLGVPLSADMTNPEKYRDGDGAPWKQNSSYGTSRKISTGSVEKWKSVLSAEEIRFIELVCGPDMALWKYECVSRDLAFGPGDVRPPAVPLELMSEWIRPIGSRGAEYEKREMQKERRRREILAQGGTPGEAEIETMFYGPRYFEMLKPRKEALRP